MEDVTRQMKREVKIIKIILSCFLFFSILVLALAILGVTVLSPQEGARYYQLIFIDNGKNILLGMGVFLAIYLFSFLMKMWRR